MKKGIPYRTWKFKFKAGKHYILNLFAYLGVFIVSFVSLILKLIILCNYNECGKAYVEDIFNAVIAALTLTISFIGIIYNLRASYRDYFNKLIVQQAESKTVLRASIVENISTSYADSGFEWRDYDGQSYLVSDRVNEALVCNHNYLFITVNPKKQPMNIKQKEVVYNVVAKKIAEGKSIFNSDLVRLRTDILLNTFDPFNSEKYEKEKRKHIYTSFSKKLIVLEKTDYEANLTTNDLIYSTIFQYDYSDSYSGKDNTVDSRNTLYDLKDSPASNIIGVTTFAITSDGYLLLNLQGAMNDVNNECYVPSGSGSSDFDDLINSTDYEPKKMRNEVKEYKSGSHRRDEYDDPKKFKKFQREYVNKLKSSNAEHAEIAYINAETAKFERKGFKKYASKMGKKYTYDFYTFLKYGMVRELTEESHIYERKSNQSKQKYKKLSAETRKKYIENTYVCGYIRILDRGGKPDFFGFTLLDLTRDEVKDMFRYGHDDTITKEIKKNCLITDYNEISKQFYPSIKNIEKYETAKDFIVTECHLDHDAARKVKVSLQTHCLFDLLKKNKNTIFDYLSKIGK